MSNPTCRWSKYHVCDRLRPWSGVAVVAPAPAPGMVEYRNFTCRCAGASLPVASCWTRFFPARPRASFWSDYGTRTSQQERDSSQQHTFCCKNSELRPLLQHLFTLVDCSLVFSRRGSCLLGKTPSDLGVLPKHIHRGFELGVFPPSNHHPGSLLLSANLNNTTFNAQTPVCTLLYSSSQPR